MTKSKVIIVGSGGVGAIAAYGLEYGGKAEVTLVIRSDYDVVKKEGFEIKSCDYGHIKGFKPSKIVKSVEDASKFDPFDFIIVTTKNIPDVFKVEDIIEPIVTKNSTIVLLQNGIDIGAPILKRFPENKVLSGVSMISSTNYNGFIDHEGKDALKIGYFHNENIDSKEEKEACDNFIDIYANGLNSCTYDQDVKSTRWRKLVYNATFNTICTLTGVDTGRLELFGGVDSLVRKAMREVLNIAKSDGADIPESVIETMIRSDDGLYYSPSMLVDLRKGNFIEIEVICGNAVRISEKNGVEAPILTLVYDLLKVVQCKTKEAKGLIVVPKERSVPENRKT